MVKEIMDEIHKAEQQAEQDILDAGNEAQSMIDNTKKEIQSNR